MEALAALISSIASLAWPVVFLILVFKFFEPIKALIKSARGRKFTLKVAGNELTMEEASKQQRVLVTDLVQHFNALDRFQVEVILARHTVSVQIHAARTSDPAGVPEARRGRPKEEAHEDGRKMWVAANQFNLKPV